MKTHELLYGEPQAVASYLAVCPENQVTVGKLAAALSNALTRIDWLEKQNKQLLAAVSQLKS